MTTAPEEFTVATAVLLLLQTPPGVASLNVKPVPIHPPVLPEIFVIAATVGVWLTVMFAEAAAVQLFESVTVNEYVPEAAVVALAIEAFCREEEKLFGPDQL